MIACTVFGASLIAGAGVFLWGHHRGVKHGMLVASNALDALGQRVGQDAVFGPPEARQTLVAVLDEAAKALRRA